MQKKLLFFHLLLISIAHSQNNDTSYILEYITTKQGLPHEYVTSIISDDLNVKWIGTENGLTKYNGRNFEYIKPGENYTKLKNENIEVLFKDQSDVIWIGTKSGGISSLNIRNKEIKNYNHLIDKQRKGNINVKSIASDNKGNVWIGTWRDGVFVINPTQNKLIKHIKIRSVIHSIIKDNQSNIWVSYYQTLSKFNTKGDRLAEYNLKTNLSDLILDKKRNKIWIGTSVNSTKLYHYDLKTQKIGSIETGVKSEFHKTLALDAQNRLWIGTWIHGLYRSNSNLTNFSKIELVSPNSDKIETNYTTILKIHHDKNNQTWIATANGGVVKLIEGKEFKNASEDIENGSLNGELNFTAICKSKKNLLVGTLNNGVYVGTNFSNLKPLLQIDSREILTIYEYQNKFFIGTSTSFYMYDINTNQIIFSHKKIKKATAFYVDKNNILYIGTQQNGIAVVPLQDIANESKYSYYSDLKKGIFKIGSNQITGFQEDSKGNIWVGTHKGLHLYNKVKKKFTSQELQINDRLPSVVINDIALKNDYIWLGTSSGLIKLAYQKGKLNIVNQITKEKGLNSDFICSIGFDAKSNVWLSTKTEIVKYNEKNRSFVSYGENYGVKTTAFNSRSFFNFENKIFYFGGIDNITYFNPEKTAVINSTPEVIFTNLRINNKVIGFTEENAHKITKENFSYVDRIELDHSENFFSIGFIANDFLDELNTKYRYKLQGYQDKWFDIQYQNEINFADLGRGEYVLKIASYQRQSTLE